MSAELIVLSVGAAAAALIVTRVLSLRADARGDARSTGRARDVLGRAGTAAHGSGPAGGGPTSARASQEIHHVPAPRGGTAYDPRPSEDKARRRIAYLLIALLALMIVALLAAVVFGVIPSAKSRSSTSSSARSWCWYRRPPASTSHPSGSRQRRSRSRFPDARRPGSRRTRNLPAAVHQPARGCRGGRHGSPAAIPDDDTPAVTVDPHDLTLLKGPERGSFLNADPGSLCLPLHIMSPVITGYRVASPATDASQAQRAPRISRANLRVIRYRAGRSRGVSLGLAGEVPSGWRTLARASRPKNPTTRYRDAPFRAVFNGCGIGYVVLNAAVSYGAFGRHRLRARQEAPAERAVPGDAECTGGASRASLQAD